MVFRITSPEGILTDVDGRLVVRARRAISGEQLSEGARTRIDWHQMNLAQEPLDHVVAAVRAELATFVAVTSSDGSKIWINAAKATGPVPLTPSQMQGGVRSSLKIMGYRQFVTETPDEIRAIITAANGVALP
jgi:hypothetical protein